MGTKHKPTLKTTTSPGPSSEQFHLSDLKTAEGKMSQNEKKIKNNARIIQRHDYPRIYGLFLRS